MKIVYFLLGFFMSVAVGLQYAHADCTDPMSLVTWEPVYGGSWVNLGTYSTSSELYSVPIEHDGVNYTFGSYQPNSVVKTVSGVSIVVCHRSGRYLNSDGVTYTPYAYVGFYGSDTSVLCSAVPIDTDGDGLIDRIDAYPNDPVGYQFKILERYYNSMNEEVGVLIHTTRGDDILLGTDLGVLTSDIESGSVTVVSDSTGYLYDSAKLSEDQELIPINMDTGPSQVPTDIVPKIRNDKPPVDSDDNMQTPEQSTGSETAAEQKIIDNTAATAENVSRLGDYLKSINSSIKSIDSSSSQNTYNTTTIVTNTTSGGDDESNVDFDQENMSSAESAMSTASTNFNPTQAISDLTTELQDDVSIEDLPDQTGTEGEGLTTSYWDYAAKITEFVSENPITQALTGIEVETVGNCSFEYNWVAKSGVSHPITFSVCGFQAELNLFGQVLLMITSFNAIFLLFRRN